MEIPDFEPAAVRVLDGGADRDQTDDLVVANDALYQLSYCPVRKGSYLKSKAIKSTPILADAVNPPENDQIL